MDDSVPGNFGLVHPLNICTSCNVNSQLFCLAVAYSFTPGPISYHKRMEDVDIQKMWPTFFYFRFPPPWYTPSNSLLYDIGEFLFLFSPFLVQNCPHSFFFLFWHLTLYGRLPKILAPKFAKYVLSSSIVLISVFGHVVDPERKAPILLFSLSAAVN